MSGKTSLIRFTLTDLVVFAISIESTDKTEILQGVREVPNGHYRATRS